MGFFVVEQPEGNAKVGAAAGTGVAVLRAGTAPFAFVACRQPMTFAAIVSVVLLISGGRYGFVVYLTVGQRTVFVRGVELQGIIPYPMKYGSFSLAACGRTM